MSSLEENKSQQFTNINHILQEKENQVKQLTQENKSIIKELKQESNLPFIFIPSQQLWWNQDCLRSHQGSNVSEGRPTHKAPTTLRSKWIRKTETEPTIEISIIHERETDRVLSGTLSAPPDPKPVSPRDPNNRSAEGSARYKQSPAESQTVPRQGSARGPRAEEQNPRTGRAAEEQEWPAVETEATRRSVSQLSWSRLLDS